MQISEEMALQGFSASAIQHLLPPKCTIVEFEGEKNRLYTRGSKVKNRTSSAW